MSAPEFQLLQGGKSDREEPKDLSDRIAEATTRLAQTHEKFARVKESPITDTIIEYGVRRKPIIGPLAVALVSGMAGMYEFGANHSHLSPSSAAFGILSFASGALGGINALRSTDRTMDTFNRSGPWRSSEDDFDEYDDED